jgi:hypothetical protein
VNSSTPVPASRRRSPLLFIVGGCAIAGVCLLLGCAAIAGYSLLSFPIPGTEPPPSQDIIRTELAALPAGNAASGMQIFGSTGTCVACHSLELGVRVVGPSLSSIAARADIRKAGYSADMYLYESIAYPRAFVVPGFPNDVMPADFKHRLNPQQFADLIAFLLTK